MSVPIIFGAPDRQLPIILGGIAVSVNRRVAVHGWVYALFFGACRENREPLEKLHSGNYYSILGLYRDNGKENGDNYGILGQRP